MGNYIGCHNADKRTIMKNQNRSSALGWQAIKLLAKPLLLTYRVSQKAWTFFESAAPPLFMEETFPNFL